MDALKTAYLRPGFLLGIVWLAAATPTGDCRGDNRASCPHGGHGDYFDGTTLCRWHRTAHGPNSVWRPLRRYYVPRPADPCMYGGYGRCCPPDDNEVGIDLTESAHEYEGGDLSGYGGLPELTAGLERLGQVPNDLGISAAAAAPRPGR